MSFIYKITTMLNNNIYIGRTNRTIEERWREHIRSSKLANKNHIPLYKAFNKYGITNFCIEEIEEVPYNIVDEKEKYYIQYYNSYYDGYNATMGGDGSAWLDYKNIDNLYQQNLSPIEISKIMNCSIDSVYDILHNLGYTNLKKIADQKKSKSIKMIDGDIETVFISQAEAAKWLVENEKTKQKSIDNISANIGRAIKYRNGYAFGYYWQYI